MANQSRSSFWRHVDQFRALIIIPASESAALKIEFKIIIIIIITTEQNKTDNNNSNNMDNAMLLLLLLIFYLARFNNELKYRKQ